MEQFGKYAFLFWFGGSSYVSLEVIYRQRSHYTMLILAGLVFIIVDLFNEIWKWNTSLIIQVAVGTIVATIGEFIVGCIVNLWLGWNIWDYSDKWGNILGQICPQFTLLWIPLILVAIVLADVIRWRFFNEEKPKYKL